MLILSMINQKMRLKYRACIAITGAIQGTSQDRLYPKLGIASDRR